MSMHNYKIESYVPEENFFCGKDESFCHSAFENCFVVDVQNNTLIIAACRNAAYVGRNMADAFSLSMASTASLLNVFNGSTTPQILAAPKGTLLVYPAWQRFDLALVFFLKEDCESVEKAYQNAQRYAFSAIFDVKIEEKSNPLAPLEYKLCALHFYTDRLFGATRETNVTAHVLMIAALMGCRLREVSVLQNKITLSEQELERFEAYLFCVFMTMRRYNGEVRAETEEESDTVDAFSTPVLQEYGLRIQQRVRDTIKSPTPFDLPPHQEMASFANHPVFTNYRMERSDGVLQLRIPLYQKALLSSVAARNAEKELLLILFPIKQKSTCGKGVYSKG